MPPDLIDRDYPIIFSGPMVRALVPCSCYGRTLTAGDKERLERGMGILVKDKWNKEGDHVANCPAKYWVAIAAALTQARTEAEEEIADGNRGLPFSREELGRMVREAWVRWAQTQPAPKASWLAPWEELNEPDKEADRQIGEAVARWVQVAIAQFAGTTAIRALPSPPVKGEK